MAFRKFIEKPVLRFPIAEYFIAILLISIPVTIGCWWIAGSYFHVDIFTSLSFMPGDGWCEPTVQGLGVHCFGDYYYAEAMALTPNPWDASIGINPYPGAGLVPFAASGHLGHVLGIDRLGVCIYLTASVVSLSAPCVWAARHRSFVERAAIYVVIGPLTLVGIQALDRGNSIALIVLPLLWFLVAVLRRNSSQMVFAVIVCSAIKPQFLLLLAIPCAMRWWRVAGIGLLGCATVNLLGFLVWPSAFPASMRTAAHMASEFQGYAPLSDLHPIQVSLAQGIYVLEVIARRLTGMESAPESYLTVSQQSTIGIAFLLIVLVWIVALGKRMDPVIAGSILVAAIAMSAGTTYGYYSVVVLPIAAILIRTSYGNPSTAETRRIVQVLISLALFASLIRIPLPIVKMTWNQLTISPTTALISSLVWAAVIVVILLVESLPNLRSSTYDKTEATTETSMTATANS